MLRPSSVRGLLHFVLGWTPGLVWSFPFAEWECTCCLHFPWSLCGITPTSPPAPVHFCIIVVAAHFHQGLGFALIRAGMHLQIFLASRGWDGWHLAAFLHCVPDVTPAPSLPFIFPRVLAPVCARITSLWIYVLWFFPSCSVVALEGDSWCPQTNKTPFPELVWDPLDPVTLGGWLGCSHCC